jgi:hypothetical protein
MVVITGLIHVLNVVRPGNPIESDDEYCRRKDRTYALKADELIALKKQRDMVKQLMVRFIQCLAFV